MRHINRSIYHNLMSKYNLEIHNIRLHRLFEKTEAPVDTAKTTATWTP